MKSLILTAITASLLVSNFTSNAVAQALPEVKGFYVTNKSSETIDVGLLYTFIGSVDGYVYNSKIRTLRPGEQACLGSGAADTSRTYYLFVYSKDHNRFCKWGNDLSVATVDPGTAPVLTRYFGSFKNKYVADRVAAGDFNPLLKHFASRGNKDATRIKPTSNYNRISVDYQGNGNGNVKLR